MGNVFSKHPLLIQWEKQKNDSAFKSHFLFEHSHILTRINPNKNESILEISPKSIATLLAKSTHPKGQVFVVQNDINSIRKVISKSCKAELLNIEPILIENYFKSPKLPLESNFIDKAIIVDTLHKLSEKNQKNAISEMTRVLKKNSKLLIVDVMKNTGLDKFLINFIYPISQGTYKTEALEAKTLLSLSEKSELKYVSGRLEYVPLIFNDHKQMLDYFKAYYKIDCSDSTLLKAVHEYLGFLKIDNLFLVNVELLFALLIKK